MLLLPSKAASIAAGTDAERADGERPAGSCGVRPRGRVLLRSPPGLPRRLPAPTSHPPTPNPSAKIAPLPRASATSQAALPTPPATHALKPRNTQRDKEALRRQPGTIPRLRPAGEHPVLFICLPLLPERRVIRHNRFCWQTREADGYASSVPAISPGGKTEKPGCTFCFYR